MVAMVDCDVAGNDAEQRDGDFMLKRSKVDVRC
jgi:hypothetical protein